MDWDVYAFQAGANCKRCGKALIVELTLPGPVVAMIPSDKRDEAMREMSRLAERRVKAAIDYMDPDDPPCEARS